MNLAQFLILQLIAHLLADFIFQTKSGAKDKDEKGFRSRYLKWHILIVFATTWAFSFQLDFVFGAFIISILHYLQDGLKRVIPGYKNLNKYAFFIDQALHIITVIGVVILFDKFCDINPLFKFPLSSKYLLLIATYIFCTKPVNILIKKIIIAFEISAPANNGNGDGNGDKDDDLPNAGKLIGNVERFLVLTFIILNQYEAVGFLIAAKSILRFEASKTNKAEYVLIGTMLSFGIAIASGIVFLYFDNWSKFLAGLF